MMNQLPLEVRGKMIQAALQSPMLSAVEKMEIKKAAIKQLFEMAESVGMELSFGVKNREELR